MSLNVYLLGAARVRLGSLSKRYNARTHTKNLKAKGSTQNLEYVLNFYEIVVLIRLTAFTA